MQRRKGAQKTPKKILEAAIQTFCQKGYHNATIAEICHLAGTNIASVNYHFGNKETLYIEAWREAFRYALKKYPPDDRVPEGAPAEIRLRGRIVALLRRITDPTCFDLEMVQKELATPTGLLVDAIREGVGAQEKEMMSIIREILGETVSDKEIQLCVMSIHAQCLNPMVLDKRFEVSDQRERIPQPASLEADVDSIVDHVIRFSLGGLKEVASFFKNSEEKSLPK